MFVCCTSPRVRAQLARQQIVLPSPGQVLGQLHELGVEQTFVQPTHVIPGRDFQALQRQAADAAVSWGQPLLAEEESRAALSWQMAALDGPGQTVWMGHGSLLPQADGLYADLQRRLDAIAPGRHLVATADGARGLDALLPRLESREITLRLLFFFAGAHARRDLAGPGEGSWRGRLEGRGHLVRCDLTGLGERPGVRALYRAHLRRARERKDGRG